MYFGTHTRTEQKSVFGMPSLSVLLLGRDVVKLLHWRLFSSGRAVRMCGKEGRREFAYFVNPFQPIKFSLVGLFIE